MTVHKHQEHKVNNPTWKLSAFLFDRIIKHFSRWLLKKHSQTKIDMEQTIYALISFKTLSLGLPFPPVVKAGDMLPNHVAGHC